MRRGKCGEYVHPLTQIALLSLSRKDFVGRNSHSIQYLDKIIIIICIITTPVCACVCVFVLNHYYYYYNHPLQNIIILPLSPPSERRRITMDSASSIRTSVKGGGRVGGKDGWMHGEN